MRNAQQIAALVTETGRASPEAAVRHKARQVIEQFTGIFGGLALPLNMEALASLRGIRLSDERPTYSPDAELVPEEDGSVRMRVNPDRPETRRRFSMGHEIVHTFFPGYQHRVRCRTDGRYRNRDNPDDLLEMLCDMGAAELLLPLPWFSKDAAGVKSAAGLLSLADRYGASREATIRRFAEVSDQPVIALFLSWRLKPTQKRAITSVDRPNLFGEDPAEEARLLRKLRVDYPIPSGPFADAGHFVPKDKSVENEGLLYESASKACCAEGEGILDFGPCRGIFHIWAVPLYTHADDQGPNREVAVAGVLRPVQVKPPRSKSQPRGPAELFD